MVEEYGIYVTGEWVDSAAEERFDVINPANGEVLAHFPQGTAEDVAKAMETAKEDAGGDGGHGAARQVRHDGASPRGHRGLHHALELPHHHPFLGARPVEILVCGSD